MNTCENDAGKHPAHRRAAWSHAGNARYDSHGAASFAEDFKPLGKRPTVWNIVDALLKTPGRVAYEIMNGSGPKTSGALLLALAATMLGYGIVMGSFPGGKQLWVVPVKVVIGTMASGLICLPSLHVFACVCGSSLTLRQTSGLMLMFITLAGMLMIGFAPVVWLFSQSTGTTVFMAFLHVLFWIVSVRFGLRLLQAAISHVDKGSMRIIRAWWIVFILVSMQMTTALRPLVGEFDGFRLHGRRFFFSHWVQCMKDC
ncbi:hypothetical protein ACFLSJ_02700 [Verrucomicrobiota bacterium]